MNNLLTRRQTLKTLGGALLGAAATHTPVFAEEPRPKPTLHVYPDYGWVRGLGIVPSWGANIVEANRALASLSFGTRTNACSRTEELRAADAVESRLACLPRAKREPNAPVRRGRTGGWNRLDRTRTARHVRFEPW